MWMRAIFSYVVPPSVEKNNEAKQLYEEYVAKAKEVYKALVDMGVDKEDARYILPQAVETKIIVTMNARELLHFFHLKVL